MLSATVHSIVKSDLSDVLQSVFVLCMQLPFVLEDRDRIENFSRIAQALRSNGELSDQAEAANNKPALTRGDSGPLSTHGSDAGMAQARSLGVQSQSSVSSSNGLLGMFDRLYLGSGRASDRGMPARTVQPKGASGKAQVKAKGEARCVAGHAAAALP